MELVPDPRLCAKSVCVAATTTHVGKLQSKTVATFAVKTGYTQQKRSRINCPV
jgi:hypothetical protein